MCVATLSSKTKCNVVCGEGGERREFPNALSRDDGLLGAHQDTEDTPPHPPHARMVVVLTGFSSGPKETSDAFVRSAVVLVKGKVQF